MSGVEQPLLSVASSNGAGSCQTQPTQHTRFLDRRGRFKQSLGRFNVYRKGGDWRKIYWDDPFHTVINTRTSRIIWGVFIAYFFIILFFALAYLDVSVRHPTCHVGLSSIMDAYIFSLETIQRANTIMFSNSAVIRKIRGHYYFMFQTCERRKHQLVRRTFVLESALPPECLPLDGGDSKTCASYPDPTQRQVDIDNGNRDGGLPGDRKLYKEPTKMQIMSHLRKSGLEVIVILEGIDSSTSNTMQARNSYTDEDIAWDATFERCVIKTSRGLCIDFDRFHLLKPAHWMQSVVSCRPNSERKKVEHI
ncbi:Potassium channel, inwardly rectifying, Kir [Phytophthora cactorum]|nr:Potassium channel, inwardly rectifying, Kir [Phytophthora cactorum]